MNIIQGVRKKGHPMTFLARLHLNYSLLYKMFSKP